MRCKLQDVIVAIAHSIVNRRRMPAYQQRLHVMLRIQRREACRRLRHVAQLAAKIIASISVESARVLGCT